MFGSCLTIDKIIKFKNGSFYEMIKSIFVIHVKVLFLTLTGYRITPPPLKKNTKQNKTEQTNKRCAVFKF